MIAVLVASRVLLYYYCYYHCQYELPQRALFVRERETSEKHLNRSNCNWFHCFVSFRSVSFRFVVVVVVVVVEVIVVVIWKFKLQIRAQALE